MEIFIGIRGGARQLSLDVNLTEEQLISRVDEAVSQNALLHLTDTKGQRILVPAHAIGYVQIASKAERRVGFAIG
ncbi:hypothetical protein ADJ76_05400 [Schaalia meyeri]|uniref:DUF3107 domain-containing protein n=1 Tax=Schaalia meyeri TaxID=52773 RepID=UPI0006831A8B|nr:DUF3107 domain-containing protein [Schaalia meyeri]AKU65253.1 hypothetical protein ADJ76_05400 [Schaalia meyeri]